MSYIKAKKLGQNNRRNEGTIILTADKSLKIGGVPNVDLDWIKTNEMELFLKLCKFLMSMKNINLPTAMVQTNAGLEAAKELNVTKNELLKRIAKELNL